MLTRCFGIGQTAEALDMPTGTQIIELITYFIQLTCEIKFGIFILIKQRASFFLIKREARLYLLIRVPIHYKDLQD
jgi:hypothetical protein